MSERDMLLTDADNPWRHYRHHQKQLVRKGKCLGFEAGAKAQLAKVKQHYDDKWLVFLKQFLQFNPTPSLEAVIDLIESSKSLEGRPFIGQAEVKQKRLDRPGTMEENSALNRHAFGQDNVDRPELREKVLLLLDLVAHVVLANTYFHITPEEAGLHFVDITKQIEALFPDEKDKLTLTLAPNYIETIKKQEKLNTLRELRDMWAYEQAAGYAVMSIRLAKWVEYCRKAGIKDNWWELKEK